MNEVYVEWLIEKKTGSREALIRIVSYAVTIIFLVSAVAMSPLFFIPAVLAAALCYFMLPRLNVEYEYLYLNKSLTIDKIFSKEKRKNAAEFDLEKMEIYAEEGAHQLDNYKNNAAKVLDFSSGYPDRRRFILMIRDENGLKKVILEPDKRITDAIKQVYPSKVFVK